MTYHHFFVFAIGGAQRPREGKYKRKKISRTNFAKIREEKDGFVSPPPVYGARLKTISVKTWSRRSTVEPTSFYCAGSVTDYYRHYTAVSTGLPAFYLLYRGDIFADRNANRFVTIKTRYTRARTARPPPSSSTASRGGWGEGYEIRVVAYNRLRVNTRRGPPKDYSTGGRKQRLH